jgi:hypothetical protein
MHPFDGKKSSKNFPDPLAPAEVKQSQEYGIQYAKAIENQWGKMDDDQSIYRRRYKEFERNRDYANGVQDTTIYKQILNSLDPNNGDGTLLNLDWSPVPIIPKFVKIVVNNILSSDPYPNVDAVDPISSSEKDAQKRTARLLIENKPFISEMKSFGVESSIDVSTVPDTLEEAEIFIDTNIKTDAEVAAQIALNATLSWSSFNDSVYRRCINDLVSIGISVTKRQYDPAYGIVQEYIDPVNFIHSYTDDPGLNDLSYAGHIKRITIQELKRIAGDQFTEEQYKQMADKVKYKYGNESSKMFDSFHDRFSQQDVYGYNEFTVEVLEFEFLSVDPMYFEDKTSRFGNIGFYYKGNSYKYPKNSVFERTPYKIENTTVYGGKYIVGCGMLFDYGLKTNIPKNMYDISKARMSYSAVAVNMRKMMPKSLVSSVIGFADLLQITHLKLQQAIAKAKPDGIIVDIEGLENVQLGRGGELQPLDIQDIYEQTGVFYYRSKNPEGGFQNPPVRSIENSIRNINELIALYNHYLRMIRDATGINEVMDATTPKGDALVGVREQAMAAANNAIYDVKHSSMILYKKVCEDIIKCIQILPYASVLFKVYENAIGKTNMRVLSSFSDLPMYNFGVLVQTNMSDKDRTYLEQNIQIALSQKEIDIEDAIAIRQLRDVDQAERLLIVRRKKRMKANMDMAQQNSQAQAQANIQVAQATSQARVQEMQVESQLKMEEMKIKSMIESQILQLEYSLRKDIELMKSQAMLGIRSDDQDYRRKLESFKEDRKDDRVEKQAVQQSKLISQKKGDRGELDDSNSSFINSLIQQ